MVLYILLETEVTHSCSFGHGAVYTPGTEVTHSCVFSHGAVYTPRTEVTHSCVFSHGAVYTVGDGSDTAATSAVVLCLLREMEVTPGDGSDTELRFQPWCCVEG
ncbi:hypothetical protein NDU88_000248 [Pleurodeles waltl]|uniref:Uncharacterized protein n=1 Tax=Pleurodeles waltl TaxID=8319 RepID=A0AAV7WGZ3_PLEWA|nr:hypothetical protein NDU88_000248 [Pleurodeles waltl]